MIFINNISNNKIIGFSENIEKSWIKLIIHNENKIIGDIKYIFCNDNFLYTLNYAFLNHDTFTDIITFPTSDNPIIISGEIYISLDRIKENSSKFHTSYISELHRVMAHGVLHLIGFDDHSTEDIEVMRSKENYYLNLHP